MGEFFVLQIQYTFVKKSNFGVKTEGLMAHRRSGFKVTYFSSIEIFRINLVKSPKNKGKFVEI